MTRQNLLAAAIALIEDVRDDELDDIIALASISSVRTERNRVHLYNNKRFRKIDLVDSASIRQYCLVVMGDSVLHNLCSAETDFLDDLNNARPPGQVANDNVNAIQADDATKGLSESNREAAAKTEC
ncbi:hypothetical protein HPB47_015889 [Ixodes persulcatus]|uniref:Uncharacterized protein n=1 Tax=Ixodes persulcatus TaxID=34615 RepID=A0AC60R0C7_IXOPE|nr:hypothetical protein HPB47_015889 [Ixodes persulcatus]